MIKTALKRKIFDGMSTITSLKSKVYIPEEGDFPAELQKCEWIGFISNANNSQKCYIDTNVKMEIDSVFNFSGTLINVYSSYGVLLGFVDNSSGFALTFHARNGDFTFAYRGVAPTINMPINTFVDCELNNVQHCIKMNGTIVNYPINQSWVWEYLKSEEHVYLATRNDYGSSFWGSSTCRINSFKAVSSNFNTNFIPCYVKQGRTFKDIKGNTCTANIAGFYEEVSKKFYTNDGTDGLQGLTHGTDI